jgi:RDD family
LRFEDQPNHAASGSAVEAPAFPQRIVTASHQALALDGSEDYALGEIEMPASASLALDDAHAPQQTVAPAHVTAPTKIPTTAKIIEFPRSWTPTPPPVDQLAEPVMDRPRILEAPEVVPPPPALGGITIEPAQQSEFEKRPGIDIPLQTAQVGRRILSAVIDDFIIGLACFLFGFIFWKITALSPPRFQLVGIVLGFSGVFWAAYQYLLLVYAGTTPGLRLARLQLSRFNGSSTSRRTRRWRVLASYLSAVSLGMGYAWVFLDEDALCWHDRITHTYLAPRARRQSPEN